MIKISKMADYATVIMAYLGRLERHATAREIAEETGITWPTVCKSLKLLVKNQLLESTRGASGGYGLAREAEAITLAEILSAMDDEIAMTECATHQGQCARQSFCQVSDHWRLISQVIQTALDGITLADLLAPSEEIPQRAKSLGLLKDIPVIVEAE